MAGKKGYIFYNKKRYIFIVYTHLYNLYTYAIFITCIQYINCIFIAFEKHVIHI